MTVIGARPQFVKAAPVSAAFAQHGIQELQVDTGQHYDPKLSSVIRADVGLRDPDVSLNVGSGTHANQTAQMLLALEPVVMSFRPDAVVVFGDTNSTLAGALVASKLHVPVAHVEAGLRSFNRRMPEEINRVMVDHISTWTFCTSVVATAQLRCEGIVTGVHLVGDVMRDATNRFAPVAARSVDVGQFGVTPKNFAVATIHRAQNTDDRSRLSQILSLIASWPQPVVLPVHPRLREALRENGLSLPSNVCQSEPCSYIEMLALVQNATHVLTDSGGLQKEAFWLQTPCITLREETEWVETVELGWNSLVGVDKAKFSNAAFARRPDPVLLDVYGDGHAAAKIAQILKEDCKCAASTGS